MSSMSNWFAPRLLDHATGVATWTNGPLFVALSTQLMTAATSQPTEPSGGGYARQAVTMKSATAGPPAQTTNAALVKFDATAAWGDILAGAIMTAITAGEILWQGPLVSPKNIGAGESLEFQEDKIGLTMA